MLFRAAFTLKTAQIEWGRLLFGQGLDYIYIKLHWNRDLLSTALTNCAGSLLFGKEYYLGPHLDFAIDALDDHLMAIRTC
jgi:hypothetical protein